MLRRIIAVIVGFVVASVAMIIMFNQPRFEGVWWYLLGFGTTHLPMFYLPALLGGFISGCIAWRRGWLYGLIVGVLLMTVGIMTMFFYFWTLYHTPNIVERMMGSIYYYWTHPCWEVLAATISGTVGGFLGQLLAQKWHKRAEQNVDASQSEH